MTRIIKAKQTIITFLALLICGFASAQDVEQEIQTLKGDMVDIAAQMQILEEQMLYPDAEQVSVFLSVDAGNKFTIQALKLYIDDVEVAKTTYNTSQTDALNRGGIERLYIDDIELGEHTYTAIISGLDKHGNKTKRGITSKHVKSAKASAIEISITYSNGNLQPNFSVVKL